MGLVTISLNGRSYRLSCGAGQEGRLRELAEQLDQKIQQLAMDSSQYGDERLLVLAALLTTDELLEHKARAAGPLSASFAAEQPSAVPQRSAKSELSPSSGAASATAQRQSEADAVPVHLAEATPGAQPTSAGLVPEAAVSSSSSGVKSTAAASPQSNSLEARLAQAKAAAKGAPASKGERA